MPPRKAGLNLEPLETLHAGEVPKAGNLELEIFKLQRSTERITFVVWGLIAAAAATCAALLAPLDLILCGIYLIAALAIGAGAAASFWRLTVGSKSWQALPEGATEATALLEDSLSKSVREWNADASRWHAKLAALHDDAGLWRLKREDQSRREEGWSEASHAMEGETLMARGKALALERHDLHVRRRKIRRAIDRLDASLRQAKQESLHDDPKPEDG